MLLGIVSDTHGHVEFARNAVRVLEGLDAEQVIHCGDVGTPEIVELFNRWPAHYVLGNVDTPDVVRSAVERFGGTFHGRFGELEIEDRKIAFLHGDDDRRLYSTIAGGDYDLVCYGHTHVPEQHLEGRTLVANPGALYRAARHTIAIVRFPEFELTHVPV